jgi:hypothetical protein
METLTLKLDSTTKYLQFWNSFFGLTKKELEILIAFVEVNKLTEDCNICSTDNKKKVAGMVGINDYNNLNNYVKKLKDKKVLEVKENNYVLNKILAPETTNLIINIRR